MKKETNLSTIIQFLLGLPAPQMLLYIRIALAGLVILIAGSFYYIRTKSSELIDAIKKTSEFSHATEELINQYNVIIKEEESLAALLEKKSDYNNLKSYFERICKQNSLTPEAGWAESSESLEIPGNEQFEEERLTCSFKGLSTKDAITLIDNFDKDEILYLKQIELEKVEKSLTVKIMLTAKKLKQGIGA
jgi:hypothetical protein